MKKKTKLKIASAILSGVILTTVGACIISDNNNNDINYEIMQSINTYNEDKYIIIYKDEDNNIKRLSNEFNTYEEAKKYLNSMSNDSVRLYTCISITTLSALAAMNKTVHNEIKENKVKVKK